jgi:hypothetical protein
MVSMSTIRVSGKIRGLGTHYVSDLERMEIHVKAEDAGALNPVFGHRVPFSLEIGKETYQAGLRATERNSYVWICPDLTNSRHERLKLAEVLTEHRFQKNQPVTLSFNGSSWRLT